MAEITSDGGRTAVAAATIARGTRPRAAVTCAAQLRNAMRDKRIFARRRFDHRATSAHGQRATAGHHWRNGLRTTVAIGRATCATIARPTSNEVRAAVGHGRPPCAASTHGVASAMGCRARRRPAGRNYGTTVLKDPSNYGTTVLKDPSLGSDTTVGKTVEDPDPVSQRRRGSAWLRPVSRGNRHFTVGGGRLRLIRPTTGSKVPSSTCTRRPDEISTDRNSSKSWPEQIPARGGGGGRRRRLLGEEGRPRALGLGTYVTLNGSGIQLAVGPQPLWLRNHNFVLAQRIMVKRLATSRHDPLGITDSACKNLLVVVSVQYGPFNPYIPIRSTTIGKSRVARDPITMHTSWRSNSDIASVTSKDIHACKRAVNPRQRSIDSYMHRGLTQPRRLMTPSWNQYSQALFVVIVAQKYKVRNDLDIAGNWRCEGERKYRTLISLLGSLATMRRVVNYHSSWAMQRQELPGFTAGRGINPAGGAPRGG
ncbi:exportin 1 [Dorcoceras hygrometricum]|uniref:Exportin 1 n=1 Tax=Dorcoceras hygrometricum TaxID=472368 RepID=A0A2Z7BM23_9LAMI|nr:exportin 1 [Dorcoceras hygrometricum]